MTDMLAFAYSRPPPPPKMPQGLRELMEELTREVLKHGPEDVHKFCANHMKKLLEIRDGPRKMRPLTLQEKQAKAQKIVRYRTELRLNKIDKLNNGEKCDTEEEIVKSPVYTEKYLKEGLELELFDEDSKIFERPAFIKHVVGFEDVKKGEILSDQDTKGDKLNINKNESGRVEPVVDTNLSNKFESEPLVFETKVDMVNETCSQINNDLNKNKVLENEETIQPTHNDKNTLQDSKLSHENNKNAECEIKENKEEKYDVISESIVNDELTEINKKAENDETLKSEHKEKADLVQGTERTGTKEAIIQAIETVEARNMNIIIPKFVENADTNVVKSNFDSCETINYIEESNETEKMEEPSAVDIKELIKTDLVFDNIIIKDSNEQTVADLDDKETDVVNNTENNIEVSTKDKADDIEKLKFEDGTKSPEIIEGSIIANRNDEETDANNGTDNIEDPSACKSNPMLSIVAAEEDIKTELKSNSSENIEHAPTLNTDKSSEQIITVVEKNQTENEENSFHVESANAIDKLSQIHEVESDGKQKEDREYSSTVGDSSVTDKHEENLIKEPKILTPGNDDKKSVHTDNLQGDVSSSNDDTVQESLSSDDSQNNGQTTMDLETAAITIQKVFRSFLFKSRNSTFDDGASDESTIDKDSIKEDEFLTHNEINKERRTLGLSRMDSVLQTVNEEKSLSLSTDDSSTLSSAATIIQAHVRGFLVRNKLSSEKTTSTNSLSNSNPSESTDIPEQAKSKTILNIHIVPESGHYVSRDDSLLASMDLSMDGSPRTSSNLHPLGYDKSERRKQLKREDAIQSVSPPSNNSGKLSEDVDSVKEMPLTDVEAIRPISADTLVNKKDPKVNIDSRETTPTLSVTEDTVKTDIEVKKDQSLSETKKVDLDEFDVVTPYLDDTSTGSADSKLLHSGEFHDAVLPTKVSRNDSVIREFKNVLVYFLLWK